MPRALYAGSFDPVTTGHVDVIRRGLALFGELTVAVGRNASKQPLFTVEERLAMLRQVLSAERLAADAAAFDGLVVEFARSIGAVCLLRGVRDSSDLAGEAAMAQMNRRLAPELETLFLAPSPSLAFVSARLVREAGRCSADLTGLVPACIQVQVAERLASGRNHAT